MNLLHCCQQGIPVVRHKLNPFNIMTNNSEVWIVLLAIPYKTLCTCMRKTLKSLSALRNSIHTYHSL